jgi:hypothetical protein
MKVNLSTLHHIRKFQKIHHYAIALELAMRRIIDQIADPNLKSKDLRLVSCKSSVRLNV